MGRIFVIEDELHAEQIGEFLSLDSAIAELRRLAAKPWDEAPNRAPCLSWEGCGRHYELVEYDLSTVPWGEISRVSALNVSKAESPWLLNA